MKRKSKFLTFWFSWLPGAGYMYMGFMKKGVSMMSIFFGIFAVIAVFDLEIVGFALPVIWFYAFFDQLNLMGLPDRVFYSVEDRSFITAEGWDHFYHTYIKKFKKELAVLLVFFGAYELFKTLMDFLYEILPGFLGDLVYEFNYRIPKVIVAFVIILIGLRLIGGKKKELDNESFNDHYEAEMEKGEQFSYEEPVSRATDMASMYNQESHTMDDSMYFTSHQQEQEQEENGINREKTAEETYVHMAADIEAMDEAMKMAEEPVKPELSLSDEQKAKMKAAIAGSAENLEL